MELVALGQRFGAQGLAPGAAAASPAVRHCYGFQEPADLAGLEAIALTPAQRVGRRDGLLAVVRALLELGRALAALPGAAALCWEPAATAMAPDYFCRVTAAWRDGGAFPGLGLTALTADETGARSTGLALFAGHEIAVRGGESPAADARLALRALHLLVETAASVNAIDLSQALGSLIDGEIACRFSGDRKLLLIERVPGPAG